jgi:hypothetical protein
MPSRKREGLSWQRASPEGGRSLETFGGFTMLELSVDRFIHNLDSLQQGYVLYSKEAFLSYLRDAWRKDHTVRQILGEAAVAYARGERVRVSALADEREAAKGLMYAYMRLGDELRRRGKVHPKPRTLYSYRLSPPKKPVPVRVKEPSPFKTVECTINGRRETISQYPADITWEQAAKFQHDPLHELPEIDLEPEYALTGTTAHFDESERFTGWGCLMIDGAPVERVRAWPVPARVVED